METYLRFGEIPENEKSSFYFNDDVVGEENGVSVYRAIEDADGTLSVCIPIPITKTTLYTFQSIIQYENRKCYLVTGDVVGRGSDNEPLLKNVRIIREIDKYRQRNEQ